MSGSIGCLTMNSIHLYSRKNGVWPCKQHIVICRPACTLGIQSHQKVPGCIPNYLCIAILILQLKCYICPLVLGYPEEAFSIVIPYYAHSNTKTPSNSLPGSMHTQWGFPKRGKKCLCIAGGFSAVPGCMERSWAGCDPARSKWSWRTLLPP